MANILTEGKRNYTFFFLVFLLFGNASENAGFLIFDLDIIAIFPVKLGAVLRVKGFRNRGVECNARVTS